jgi:HEAT repeat protein
MPAPGPSPGRSPFKTSDEESAGRRRAAEKETEASSEILRGAEASWRTLLPVILLEKARGKAPTLGEEGRKVLIALLQKGCADEFGFNRGAALRALARAGERPEDLNAFFRDEDAESLPDVAAALGYYKEKKYERILGEYLLNAGRSPKLRASAAVSLGLRKAQIAYLSNAMDLGGDARVRGAALAGLYLHGSPGAKVTLARVATNKDERYGIRALAMGFLARLGPEGQGSPTRILTRVLGDIRPPLSVRRAAAIGLWRYPAARQALIDAAEADPSPGVRGFAWVSLGRMAPTLGAEEREKLLARMRENFRGKAPLAEGALIALGLGFAGDREGGETLLKTLVDSKNPPLLRAWCARGLGLMRHDPARTHCDRLSEVDLPGLEGLVGVAAREALALSGGDAGLASLRTTLFAGPQPSRRTAALGLAAAGTPEGRKALHLGLENESAEVRRASATALGAIRALEATGGLFGPERSALRRSAFRALGDQLDPSPMPLRYTLPLDLDPWAVEEALLLHPE